MFYLLVKLNSLVLHLLFSTVLVLCRCCLSWVRRPIAVASMGGRKLSEGSNWGRILETLFVSLLWKWTRMGRSNTHAGSLLILNAFAFFARWCLLLILICDCVMWCFVPSTACELRYQSRLIVSIRQAVEDDVR